jgi:hypothetical protein
MGYIDHRRLIHSEAKKIVENHFREVPKKVEDSNMFIWVMISLFLISWVAVYLHDLATYNARPW